MTVRVITPPAPIMTSGDIPGASAGDVDLDAMIVAIVGQWDGPSGWLGRAIGKQTLELALGCWDRRPIRLPYEPIISIVSVKYLDPDGVEQTVDPANYARTGSFLWFKPSWQPPSLACAPEVVKVRYQAGYDGTAVDGGGTGDIPAQIKRAVILSTQYLKTLGKEDLFLRVDEVEGVGRREFTVSDQAGKIIRDAAERLLQGLRIFL